MLGKAFFEFAQTNATLVVAGLLGLGYTLVRVMYGNFYAWLGFTPSEAGFDIADALARALAGFSFVAGVFLVVSALVVAAFGLLFGLVLVIRLLIVRRRKRRKRRPGRSTGGLLPPNGQRYLRELSKNPRGLALCTLVITPFSCGLLIDFQQEATRDEWGSWKRIILLVFTFAISAYGVIALSWLVGAIAGRSKVPSGLVLGAVGGFSIIFAIFQFGNAGRADADYLRYYGGLAGDGIASTSLLGYRAECVSLNPSIAGLPDEEWVLYLGRSEGEIIGFDVIQSRTVRMPTTQVVVYGMDDIECRQAASARNSVRALRDQGVPPSEWEQQLKQAAVPPALAKTVAALLTPPP